MDELEGPITAEVLGPLEASAKRTPAGRSALQTSLKR